MTNWNDAKEATHNVEARIREAAEDLRADALETAGVLRKEIGDLVSDLRTSAAARGDSLRESRKRDG